MISFFKDAAGWLQGIRTDSEENVTFILSLGALVVGFLRRESDGWVFEYAPEFKTQNHVKPIVDFPALDRDYRSPDLWPFFALRVPSMAQPNVQKILSKQHLEHPDVVTMLKTFGRRSVANPFELAQQESVCVGIDSRGASGIGGCLFILVTSAATCSDVAAEVTRRRDAGQVIHDT